MTNKIAVRKAIKDAVRKALSELDETMEGGQFPYRKDCEQFVVHLHVDCETTKVRYPLYVRSESKA